MIGGQGIAVGSFSEAGATASLRTNVSEACQAAMIELHGLAAWEAALAEQAAIDASGGVQLARQLTPEEIETARLLAIANAAPIGTGVAVLFLGMALVLSVARGVNPLADARPLLIGAAGVALALLMDWLLIEPTTSAGATFVLMAIPLAVVLVGLWPALGRLAENELLRVVFPPLVLIVAVLGSILGGITNPTPAAALGASGAIMLAAYRKLRDENRTGATILLASLALVVMLLFGINFDLRTGLETTTTADVIALVIAQLAYHAAFLGLLYACWVLFRTGVLGPVVRETAKVTSMVFTILIGSQLLNLVLISFGGEHYIQQFLRSFDSEIKVFLIVMLVLFILGFVLDFLEIIYIVIPIVGPVIYGGTLDPKWVTIMVAVNLQTSFLTPPFGFALFYLRGVAPPQVTTGHIYRGVIPFVLIQVVGLLLLWAFPGIVTIVPDLLPNN